MGKKYRHNNKGHVPSRATSREEVKQVKSEKQSLEGRPSWRFSTADIGGAFAWPSGSSDEQRIVNKLRNFDSMTWNEIERDKHHFLTPTSLSKEAQKRLSALNRSDSVDSLFSFRLGAKERVICFRYGDLALLLWYDPKHLVCPSKKKHT